MSKAKAQYITKTCNLAECQRQYTVRIGQKRQRYCSHKCAGIDMRRQKLLEALNLNLNASG